MFAFLEGGEDQFPKEKKSISWNVSFWRKSCICQTGKKRPRKRFSWVVCWGLLTQAVCANIINKLKSCCSLKECRIGGLNNSAGKILYKARKAKGYQEHPQADLGLTASIRRIDCNTGLLSGPVVGCDCFMGETNRDA